MLRMLLATIKCLRFHAWPWKVISMANTDKKLLFAQLAPKNLESVTIQTCRDDILSLNERDDIERFYCSRATLRTSYASRNVKLPFVES